MQITAAAWPLRAINCAVCAIHVALLSNRRSVQ